MIEEKEREKRREEKRGENMVQYYEARVWWKDR
jgi:hypothetical protein